jgi:hypothetical protein
MGRISERDRKLMTLKIVASIYPAVILTSTALILLDGGLMFTFEKVFTGMMMISAMAGLYFTWRDSEKAK